MPSTIAAIEDDPASWTLLGLAFKREGFAFSGTHDGTSSSQSCIREPPDAILLDVM